VVGGKTKGGAGYQKIKVRMRALGGHWSERNILGRDVGVFATGLGGGKVNSAALHDTLFGLRVRPQKKGVKKPTAS